MNIHEIGSLNNFFKTLKEYNIFQDTTWDKIKFLSLEGKLNNNYFFRGQSEKYTSIICGLPRIKGYCENENRMFSETVTIKKDDFVDCKFPIDYLSKMQHYSLPTRLVDFTVNPFISLFFSVQDYKSFDDSIIYVYKNCGIDIDDDKIKVVSLIPTLEGKTIKNLKKCVFKEFNIDYTEEEIITIITKNYFINFSKRLQNNNIRLLNQCGTFAICGNSVDNGIISEKPLDLDISQAFLKIKIPYQHKITLKSELEKELGIDDNFIYPELDSWSAYMRNKYMYNEFKIEGSYEKFSEKDVSLEDIARVEIKLKLKKSMDSEQIMLCVKDAIQKLNDRYQIIWFFVATNNINLNSQNWIKTGQWISNDVKEKFSRYPFFRLDEDNIVWDNGDSFRLREEFYLSKELQSDSEKLSIYYYLYKIIIEIIDCLKNGYEILDYENFVAETDKRKHIVNIICSNLYNIGDANDSELETLFSNYIELIILFSDLIKWVEIFDENDKWLEYRITRGFSEMNNVNQKILKKQSLWIKKLNINELKYDDYISKEIKELVFKQTLPVSKDAIDVFFNTSYLIKNDKFIIQGRTNLFDGANINIIFRFKYGDILSQQNVIVKGNEFYFICSKELLKYNKYTLLISLGFPRTQTALFLDKAGFEYENLTGKLICRYGIESTLYYNHDFDKGDINEHC